MLLFHFDNGNTLSVDDVELKDVLKALEEALINNKPYLFTDTSLIAINKITHVEVIEL